MNGSSDISYMLLSKGKYVVLFDKGLEREITQYSWYVNSSGYVACNNRACGYTYMHQFVLGFSGNGVFSPDHKNRIKTDNRRVNLRIVSQSENCRNRVVRKDSLKGTCLTEKEILFLEFTKSYIQDYKIFPTYRDIMDSMDFKSPNSVTQYLKALLKKGALKRHPLKKYVFTELSKNILYKKPISNN